MFLSIQDWSLYKTLRIATKSGGRSFTYNDFVGAITSRNEKGINADYSVEKIRDVSSRLSRFVNIGILKKEPDGSYTLTASGYDLAQKTIVKIIIKYVSIFLIPFVVSMLSTNYALSRQSNHKAQPQCECYKYNCNGCQKPNSNNYFEPKP